MTTAIKYFQDNISRLTDSAKDLQAFNLNSGLLALAKDVRVIQAQHADMQLRIDQLATLMKQSPSR